MRSLLRFLAPALVLGAGFMAPGPARPAASAPCTFEQHIPVGYTFEPRVPCPRQDVTLWVGGCRECVTLLGIERIDSVTVRVRCSAPPACPPIFSCTAESLGVSLGRFSLGQHQVRIEVEAEIQLADGDSCSVTQRDSVEFSVVTECPPETNLPYVESVRIGPTAPCAGCQPESTCAGHPIPVALSGHFPNDCLYLREVRVQDLQLTPVPHPPIVTLVVGKDACLPRGCIEYPVPWSAKVELPGLPPGGYSLPLRVERVDVQCDTITQVGFWASTVPFSVVLDSCAAPRESCFIASWDHSGSHGCDAFVGPDHPADVTLQIATPIALAGLQGRLVLWPAGLRISGLTPVGPAAGMHIAWTPTADGARFVLFADQGAPIPPEDTLHTPVPVLRVTASATAGTPIPPVTYLQTVELLGSDEQGGRVGECVIVYVGGSPPIIETSAHICAGTPCDFNADGITDVRDLVLMAHCVLQSGYCPPDATAHLDCDGNGQIGIDDVLCCARVLLRGPVPIVIPGRSEPGIHLSFLEPVTTAAGLDLPMRLEGADKIGAARLAIRYPGDRFDVTSVELAGGGPGWLSLHEAKSDELVLGLIGLGPAAGSLDFTIHLA